MRWRGKTGWGTQRTKCGIAVLLPFLTLLLSAPASVAAAGLRFYGDLLFSRGIDTYTRENRDEAVRRAIAPFLARDAIHVVNLEGAAGNACDAGRAPCFSIRAPMFDLLSGFDVVSLENNHALDTGNNGARRTAQMLRQRGIAPLAGNENSTLVETGAGTFAIVAATDVVNADSDRKHLRAADAPELLAEIRRLKRLSSVVAVYVHWGRELIAAPTDRMRELARQYVAAGADVVVGTHPHVPSGAACIEGKPVAWSLGNFLFDQKYDATKRGALFDCDIVGGRLVCRLTGHETARGSYLPALSAGDPYQNENALLANCTPAVTAVWTGKFSGRSMQRLVEVPDERQTKMSHLELYDLQSGRLVTKTPAMPIRKVQPVDLNGDGIREVMLIQEIYSSLDREVAKRIYLYSFNGGFHALWRGSALSRPLLDAAFTAGRKETPQLVALHSDETFLKRRPETKQRKVMRYRWNGFGFTGLEERSAPAGSRSLRLINDDALFYK